MYLLQGFFFFWLDNDERLDKHGVMVTDTETQTENGEPRKPRKSTNQQKKNKPQTGNTKTPKIDKSAEETQTINI
jgi:hypothetical protein